MQMIYKWMGQATKVELEETKLLAGWLIMLVQPGQRYCMGSLEFEDGQYVAQTKGRKFVAVDQGVAVMLLMDFMHDEAMAAKIALQSVVVDNLLSQAATTEDRPISEFIKEVCPSCNPRTYEKSVAKYQGEVEVTGIEAEYLYACIKCGAKLWVDEDWAKANAIKI